MDIPFHLSRNHGAEATTNAYIAPLADAAGSLSLVGMRGLVLLTLGLVQSGTLRYHFTDDDGRRFELKLGEESARKVSFQLPLPAQQRLLLHVNERKDEARKLGRYAMGYPIPESAAVAGVLAGGATLLTSIIADFATHTRPDRP